MRAAVNEQTSIVDVLIKAGADINIQDFKTGASALIIAATEGDNEIVDALLKV